MTDKITESLVEALKRALTEPGEQRLFRSGKLEGLFPARNGAVSEAATRAVREGLLEVVRTDLKGKTTIEWVRLTPRGVEFLHEHESPVLALRDLRGILQTNREALPAWLGQMQQELNGLSARMAEQVQGWTHRLEALSRLVEEALRRADAGPPGSPDGVTATVPWALDALAYLDHRRAQGAAGDCTLPELFNALRQQHADLSVKEFHHGLRRLADRRALNLLAFGGASNDLPEPEYALLAGATILYYATR